MKTKYDDEIEKLEKGVAKVSAGLKKLEQRRIKATKPYDEEIGRIQKTLQGACHEIAILKHNKKIYIRNQELQKNKDLFKDGRTFEDLILTGSGSFKDYRYFLKSGVEVIPIIVLSKFGYDGNTDDIRSDLDVPEGHEVSIFGGGNDRDDIHFRLDIPISFIREKYKEGWIFWSGWYIDNLKSGKDTIEVKTSKNYRSYKKKKISEIRVIPKEVHDES